MTLEQAIIVLGERAEVNRAMCQNPESDFDKFCLDEVTAIDVVLEELRNRAQPEYRVQNKDQKYCPKECRRYRNE